MLDNASVNAGTVRWDKTVINRVAQAIEDQNDLDRARLAGLRLIPAPALPADKITVAQLFSDGRPSSRPQSRGPRRYTASKTSTANKIMRRSWRFFFRFLTSP